MWITKDNPMPRDDDQQQADPNQNSGRSVIDFRPLYDQETDPEQFYGDLWNRDRVIQSNREADKEFQDELAGKSKKDKWAAQQANDKGVFPTGKPIGARPLSQWSTEDLARRAVGRKVGALNLADKKPRSFGATLRASRRGGEDASEMIEKNGLARAWYWFWGISSDPEPAAKPDTEAVRYRETQKKMARRQKREARASEDTSTRRQSVSAKPLNRAGTRTWSESRQEEESRLDYNDTEVQTEERSLWHKFWNPTHRIDNRDDWARDTHEEREEEPLILLRSDADEVVSEDNEGSQDGGLLSDLADIGKWFLGM